jgi:DNA-3-methyladenine glycosylase II
VKFTFEARVPVRTPFRLDLTVDALRRLAANSVDVVTAAGAYRRALRDHGGTNVVEVTQRSEHELSVRIAGARGARWVPVIERMLGTSVDLREWYARTPAIPWLDALTKELVGLRPPRYPDAWEALAHAIVFQQISIHAAAAIMRRVVEKLSPPAGAGDVRTYPFPSPASVLEASETDLRACGLSANKVAHLRSAATAVLDGAVSNDAIESMPSVQAIDTLCSIRGIGRWSAAVVLLRGFGRLDVFPGADSGVARSIKMLSGNPNVDLENVLDVLGPVRGMLYFHLLLGRTRNLVPTENRE